MNNLNKLRTIQELYDKGFRFDESLFIKFA